MTRLRFGQAFRRFRERVDYRLDKARTAHIRPRPDAAPLKGADQPTRERQHQRDAGHLKIV
jgi:hypothetical protein